jgi:signal transduction histidine kinase
MVGDSKRLRQVFTNLLKNASKFTPDYGEIWVRSRNELNAPARLTMEVADTGIGFSAESSQRIFEPFGQGSEAVTREFGGLGLGLAICKAIIDAHSGIFRARSLGADQGATFTVELPLSETLKLA